MGKKGKLQPSYLGGIAGVFLIIGLIGLARGTPPALVNAPADIILIDLTTVSTDKFPRDVDKTQMPPVSFMHDRHTRALEGDTCRSCHLTKDDRLIFLFKRLEIGASDHDREIYHASCIECHADLAATGKSAGPLSGNCRGCHSRSPEKASSWIPLIFTPSLHYRHESAELIPPDPKTKTNCGACHHQYDPISQETTYRKGEEDSCRYCHPSQTVTNGRLPRPGRLGAFNPMPAPTTPETMEPDTKTNTPEKDIRFMSAAVHDACVACHQRLTAAPNRKAGPTECAGCHTVSAQNNIQVLDIIPRMKRQQPDAVLMAPWLHRDDLGKEAVATEINPVAFNHKAHEGYKVQDASCRRCHHNALNACRECHTREGKTLGALIGLNQAMHDPASTTTCVGCHRNQTFAKSDCAGCHAARPRSGFEEQNCRICHGVDKTTLPAPPLNKTLTSELAVAALITRANNREAAGTLPPLNQIPDRVRIDALMETYEAVDLPHRKIIQDLDRRIKANELAQTFHPDPLTMCVGCHHHSPASLKPPKCVSCHSPHQPVTGDGRPALAAAYHNQCMGCHNRMEIQKPRATACNECHPKRDKK